jgi:hypothetical protein
MDASRIATVLTNFTTSNQIYGLSLAVIAQGLGLNAKCDLQTLAGIFHQRERSWLQSLNPIAIDKATRLVQI